MYEQYLKTTETSRWELSTEIDWDKININSGDTKALRLLTQAALIEAFAPVYVTRGLSAWWDTVDESAIFSIQFYDEYKHFYALRRYLKLAKIEIPDKKIIALRGTLKANSHTNPYRYLANYMISEHFTAFFYMRLLGIIAEPNLQRLISLIMKDEFRHSNIFYDMLDKHQKNDKHAVTEAIMQEATDFHHFGEEVVGKAMPMVNKNDIEVMVTLNRKIQSLTGTSIIDYNKKTWQKKIN